MIRKFLNNCKKPTGKFGKMIVSAMNKGHAPLALWAFEVCPLSDGKAFWTSVAAEAEILSVFWSVVPKVAPTELTIRKKALHADAK